MGKARAARFLFGGYKNFSLHPETTLKINCSVPKYEKYDFQKDMKALEDVSNSHPIIFSKNNKIKVQLDYDFKIGIPTYIPDYFEKALLSGKYKFNIVEVEVSMVALNHRLY